MFQKFYSSIIYFCNEIFYIECIWDLRGWLFDVIKVEVFDGFCIYLSKWVSRNFAFEKFEFEQLFDYIQDFCKKTFSITFWSFEMTKESP